MPSKIEKRKKQFPKIEKIIYLLRHGESTDNPKDIFQRSSASLSSTGKKQAEIAAKVLKGMVKSSCITIELIISSPLARAKQTAQILAKELKVDYKLNSLFVERKKPTSIEGKSANDSKAWQIFLEWENSLYDNPKKKVQDGENFVEISIRAKKALESLLNCKERHILVVTHGFFIRMLVLRALLGKSATNQLLKSFYFSSKVDYCSLTTLAFSRKFLEFEDHWIIVEFNRKLIW